MKPRLAVAYDVDCFSPIEIVSAIGEDCNLLWVVDSSQPLGPMSGMLSRTGTVVDVAGLSLDAGLARVGVSRPNGIVAFSDSQLSTASVIAAGLRLRFNPPSVTRLFLDKYEQRIMLRESGFVVPAFASVPADASAAHVVALTAHLVFPAVMKPRHGSGSRDTYRVESVDALVRLLATIRGDRVDPWAEYIVEEYLAGSGSPEERAFADYVSVESVVVDGHARHLAVTGKFALAEPFRETGNFMPSLLSFEDIDSVTELTDRMVGALGVEHGCLHTEIKLTPTGPRLIESNARVGGGGIESLFAASYGESLVRIAGLVALGLEIPADIERRSSDIAYQLFVQPPISAQRLVRVDGLEAVSTMPGVAQLFLNRRAGDQVDWRDGSLGYVVTIRGTVPDHEELRSLHDLILDQLDFGYS